MKEIHSDTPGFQKIKGALGGNRLVLVSNRGPYTHEKSRRGIICERTVGGLVSALDPVMQSCGGVWVAWGSGNADFVVTDSQNRVRVPCEDTRYTLKRIRLSEREISRYYYGFSNRVLWPIFHLFPEKVCLKTEYWNSYQKVNEKFAKGVLEETKPNDLIWVQDYHLSLVPRLVRDENKDAKIAFFWHIPWPHWDTFSNLPWREEILNGLLSSDIIGFHTESYVKNFLECVKKGLDIPVDNGIINLPDRQIRVKAVPIGVDCEQFTQLSRSVILRAARLHRRLHTKYIILGVDRLDYTKGIMNKLMAFERFLEKYPEFHEKVVLVQTATPTRTKVEEYREMKKEIDETVGRINGRFQRIGWVPIRYFYRTISQDRLLTYYKAADVALITPLIDGMNLVAKEYIATKDNGGVLILSEFAGAAEELNEAILVNPHDTDAVADAIKNALEMSSEEKKQRFDVLKEKTREHDVYWWLERFFTEWRKTYEKSV